MGRYKRGGSSSIKTNNFSKVPITLINNDDKLYFSRVYDIVCKYKLQMFKRFCNGKQIINVVCTLFMCAIFYPKIIWYIST